MALKIQIFCEIRASLRISRFFRSVSNDGQNTLLHVAPGAVKISQFSEFYQSKKSSLNWCIFKKASF